MRKQVLAYLACMGFVFCTTVQAQLQDGAGYIHRALKQVTDIMVYDIYSPPVASRTYAYACIAGYEAALYADPRAQSLAGQLTGLKPLPKPDATQQYDYALAAVHAILTVARTMVVSENVIDTFYTKITNEIKAGGTNGEVFNHSIAFGQEVAAHILAWAMLDNYRQSRTFSKFAVIDEPAVWKPTPPAYIKAVEPHWNTIRPFLMDSAQQFKPLPNTPFSVEKNSVFYTEAMAVYTAGLTLTAEQKAIANFWDCNPFKMNVNGHVMFASKKISPGGHWMNITRAACEKRNAGLAQSMEAYACVAVAMADAFISCWDEKYRSVLVRPETYINQYIDDSWMPLLQTPPFPEHSSGHSVISNVAAVMLEHLFGENFVYTDATEMEFGMPARQFTSFSNAAAEAAISRFYGGIHYMPSIINGAEEGKRIGHFILQKLKTKKDATAKQ